MRHGEGDGPRAYRFSDIHCTNRGNSTFGVLGQPWSREAQGSWAGGGTTTDTRSLQPLLPHLQQGDSCEEDKGFTSSWF